MNFDSLKRANSLNQSLFFVVAALCAGLMASYAMAPTNYWPLLITGLGVLYFLCSQCFKPYHAFICGWFFGFGYFLLSLSWIGNALLVDGNEFAWAWPLAICGLPALLSFFPALACYIYKKLQSKIEIQAANIILFTCLLFASEWLRGHLFTGFPWNLYAYAWGNNLEILQILKLIGAYGLTLITIFWGVTFGALLIKEHSIKSKTALLFLSILAGMSIYSYGYNQLSQQNEASLTNITLKLIQPNVPQSEKWKRDKMVDHFETLRDLSAADGSEQQDTIIIVWPETALHYGFLENQYFLDEIKETLKSYTQNAYLVTGVLLRNDDDSYSNSIITINNDGHIINRYDKAHLVPFGEYIPFKNWIPLETVTRFSGFRKGLGLQTLQIEDKLTFSPLICYEILFPSQVIKNNSNPDVILNVTNDGWYGISAGPYQHLLKARFRAIEENTPVIRAANTGFTAFIDEKGRFVYKSQLFKKSAQTLNF